MNGKSKLKVVVVDDDAIALGVLQDSLLNYPEVSVEGTAMNGAKGKKQILKIKPDLLFLDVELPDILGLQLLSEMRDLINWDMKVVFYTAYDKYLLDALRESAFDFLLKPFTDDDLQVIMDRFRKSCSAPKSTSFASSVNQLTAGRDSFLVCTVSGFKMLRIDQIGFFEYIKERRLWEVVLSDDTRLMLKRNTKADDIVNFSENFVQISQSFVINMNYLALINGRTCVLYPPFNGCQDLTISRGFMKEIQDRFCLL